VGALAPHPALDLDTGAVSSIHGFGPHAALLATEQGLFVAQGGWILAPSWRQHGKGAPLVGTAVTGGTAWIGLHRGVLRVTEGRVFELLVDGEPLEGVTAIAVTKDASGTSTLWVAAGKRLLSVEPRETGGTFVVRAAKVGDQIDDPIDALVGISASPRGEARLFARAGGRLLRVAGEGVTRLELGGAVDEIAGGGRFLWARSAGRLFQWDADAGRWGEATGLDGVERLLGADASGAAWVRAAGRAYGVTRGPVPRVLGLDQNMLLHEAELPVLAVLPPGVDNAEVTFRVNGGMPIAAKAPLFSLGGEESDGRPRAFSFAALGPGQHAVTVDLRMTDGKTGSRAVVFDYRPATGSAPSFARDIAPINEARCLKCHVKGPGPDYSTYELWKTHAQKIVKAVRDRRMPADGPLDPALIQKIERWVSGGMMP
jgi:hypothetical protein